MSDTAHIQVSQEAEIDRRLDELMAKLVRDELQPEEMSEYRGLINLRTQLMRPSRGALLSRPGRYRAA